MQILRQSTAIIVRVGPFVDVGDGFTPQTDITLGGNEAELLKNASVEVDISGRTWAAITNCRGWYDLTLTTSDVDTVGLLTVVVQDDSDCLPVFRDFQVVEEAVFDELFKSAAAGIEYTVWDAALTGASHNDGNSAGRRLRQIEHTSVLREEEQAQGGTSSTITLHNDASSVNGFYDDAQVVIIGDTGIEQARHIHAYDGASRVASITPDWITAPDNTSDYVIRADSEKHVHEIDTDAINAAVIADGAIDSATFAADVGSAVSGTIADVSSGVYDLTATQGTLSNVDDTYNNMIISFYDNSGSVYETKRITDYDGTGLTRVTVDADLSFPPEAGVDTFIIYKAAYAPVGAASITDGDMNTIVDKIWDETETDHLQAGSTGLKQHNSGGGRY